MFSVYNPWELIADKNAPTKQSNGDATKNKTKSAKQKKKKSGPTSNSNTNAPAQQQDAPWMWESWDKVRTILIPCVSFTQ
jgi:hypothetical protein